MSPAPDVAAWLARAHPDRRHAAQWMRSAGVALLPLGVRWSAVKVSEHEGLAVAADIDGPVIHDPGGRSVYFLVPVVMEPAWSCPRTEYLGTACWLTTPAPTTVEPPGVHWVRPPDALRLVNPRALHAALTARTAVVS
ncbi:hypothetical protein [Streptomyces californicus]|uniref:hypothetical protein n=1 Tax=Streptomyces californicus TaxID=67351 RepID=UPI003839C2B7